MQVEHRPTVSEHVPHRGLEGLAVEPGLHVGHTPAEPLLAGAAAQEEQEVIDPDIVQICVEYGCGNR